MNKNHYKSLLKDITTFVFDVDGVLTNSTVQVNEQGEQLRYINMKDTYAMRKALKNNYRISIITKGHSKGIPIALNNLGVTDIYSGVDSKIECMIDFTKKYQLLPQEILYMGDDLPDMEVMRFSGLSTCPQDATSEIRQIANYVSPSLGGGGCVRDVIRQVLISRGDWEVL